jgi:soluble lytic murein transglycosylase-like protein
MTLEKRLRAGVLALSLVAAASVSSLAWAGSPKALSDTDAQAYAAAFQAMEDGDFVGAELSAAPIQDKALSGYLSYRALMHPKAHTASFDELCGWLSKFRDLPLAERVFSLASKRKPADAAGAPLPEVAGLDGARSEASKPAREAFYSGDARTAFTLATQVGEGWIAGLSAWRLGDYRQARDYFAQIADDDARDPWLRSAGAYWAARSAAQLGQGREANTFLRQAAEAPQTFYGMIAERQVRTVAAEAAQTGQFVRAAYRAPGADVSSFIVSDPRAHRAAALAQIGRAEEARQELRAGLAMARTPDERKTWSALMDALGTGGGGYGQTPQYRTIGQYQTPPLEPANGFTIDRALVYAIVRQESAFNPAAVSQAGAYGLMQVLPSSATLATGDKRYRQKPKTLLDPATNLRVGQDYLAYLMDRGVGGDILRVVAAYNGGPGSVLKTIAMVGEDDPLLLMECLPALETRDYVEKVMTGYWTYKHMFGEQTKTLDALAGGAKRIDASLDLTDPTQPQAPAQALGVIDALLQKASLN